MGNYDYEYLDKFFKEEMSPCNAIMVVLDATFLIAENMTHENMDESKAVLADLRTLAYGLNRIHNK